MSKATGTTQPRPAIKDLRPGKTLDAVKGGTESEQISLQIAMDRLTSASTTVSTATKKASDTSSTIIGNLK